MPDEQHHATISGPVGPGNSTRRAGLLAMASVILRGGRRASLGQPASVPAEPSRPPPAYFNPLRLSDEQSSLFGEILDWNECAPQLVAGRTRYMAA